MVLNHFYQSAKAAETGKMLGYQSNHFKKQFTQPRVENKYFFEATPNNTAIFVAGVDQFL